MYKTLLFLLSLSASLNAAAQNKRAETKLINEQITETKNNVAPPIWFGWDVDISGDNAIASTVSNGKDRVAYYSNGAGNVYVFHRDNNGWHQQQELKTGQPEGTYQAGNEVAISGRYSCFRSKVMDSSYICIFHSDTTGIWYMQQTITLPGSGEGIFAGKSLLMTEDIIVAGVNTEYTDTKGRDTVNNAGAVYILTRNKNKWALHQKLVATKRHSSELFGSYIAMSGGYMAVTAGQSVQTVNEKKHYQGSSIHIYKYRPKKQQWQVVQHIKSPDRNNTTAFGTSLAMNKKFIIAGSPVYRASEADTLKRPAAYLYKRKGSRWHRYKSIFIPDTAYSMAGWAAGMNSRYAAISAYHDDNSKGCVYLIDLNRDGALVPQKLTASDGQPKDLYGLNIAMSEDAIIVNSIHTEHNKGAIYIYDLSK